MTNKFSICITSYNRKDYLKNLLDYIYEKINLEFNICIFDDNSNSFTKKYLNSIKKKKGIKIIIAKKNIGECKTIHKIINSVQSEYFMILAEDDLVNIEFIKKSIKNLDKDKTLGFIGAKSLVMDKIRNRNYVISSKWKAKKYISSLNNSKKLIEQNLFISSIIFRKNSIKNSLKICEICDERSMISMLAFKSNFKIIDMIGSCFFVHKGSQSGQNHLFTLDNNIIAQSLIKEISDIKEIKLSKDELNFFIDLSFRIHTNFMFNKLKNKKNNFFSFLHIIKNNYLLYLIKNNFVNKKHLFVIQEFKKYYSNNIFNSK